MSEQTQKLMRLFRTIGHQRPNHGGESFRPGMRGMGGPGHHGRGPMRLIKLINENDGLTNADIALELDIRPSSVSAGISNLEEAGIVERTQSADDKRISTIHITETGKKMIADVTSARDELSESVFGVLSEDEQKQLESSLTKVLDNIETNPEMFATMHDKIRAAVPLRPGRDHGPRGHHGPMGFHKDK